MAQMTHDTRTSGLAWAVLSAASFGLSGSLARGLMDAGWSSAAAVAIRILVGAAVLLPAAVVVLRGRWRLLWSNLPVIIAFGVVAVAGCQLAFFNAVARLPVGVALLIEYTAPVLVVGWMWLRHAQRPGRLTALGAVIAAAGLVLVLDLTGMRGIDVAGVAWAFAATLGAATYFVLSARVEGGLPGLVLAAAGLLVGGIVLLLAGSTGVVTLTGSAAAVAFAGVRVPWWLPVLALGVVTAAVAYVAGIVATRRLGSRLASFVALTEVVAAVVFAALLLGELPTALQLVGGALIMAGIVVVRLGESQAEPPVDGPGSRGHDHTDEQPEGATA